MTKTGQKTGPTIIKKYANRRLYNTGTSTYVTLEDLAAMVKKGEEFTVQDAKTGEDITHSVLTQIIFELENDKDSQYMLPISFLRQLIAFYGDQMQMVLPSYLEQSMTAFSKEQERMREQMASTFGKSSTDFMRNFPTKLIEEQVRRNTEMFAQAMRMFSPFPMGDAPNGRAEPKKDEPEAARPSSDELRELKEQIAAMQRKIDEIVK
ncbi:polyhydroxyalkanoate synthesis repressor PhaR [Brucella endophytica]|uniref:Polyhydroxyalkanoate synthesis repressor PhaR n=1 Tax=Brucella endophytica TaxID=1963359 RepID=A0A916WGN7_9HYPH|nr:polyhydroxyalkanoate synthesis repressor PhaR [Brucella endophytica]GGA95567.1 polyhydroxyalkanoate synthesis repressor PhaR [Brucella endophytica]